MAIIEEQFPPDFTGENALGPFPRIRDWSKVRLRVVEGFAKAGNLRAIAELQRRQAKQPKVTRPEDGRSG